MVLVLWWSVSPLCAVNPEFGLSHYMPGALRVLFWCSFGCVWWMISRCLFLEYDSLKVE